MLRFKYVVCTSHKYGVTPGTYEDTEAEPPNMQYEQPADHCRGFVAIFPA